MNMNIEDQFEEDELENIDVEALENMLEIKKSNSRTEKPLRQAKTTIRQLENEVLAECPFDRAGLTVHRNAELLLAKVSNRWADKTALRKLYTIQQYLEWAVPQHSIGEFSFYKELSVDTSKKETESSKEKMYLNIDEYKAMLDATESVRNELLISLLFDTGLRAVEAQQVVIDGEENCLNRDEREIENVQTAKRKDHSRTVYYTPRTEALLKEYLDFGVREAIPAGSVDENGYLFVGREGGPLHTYTINKIIDEIAQRAGIQEVVYSDETGQARRRINVHTFRYTFAVMRIKTDVGRSGSINIELLRRMMGHNELEDVKKYLKYDDEQLKKANEEHRPRL